MKCFAKAVCIAFLFRVIPLLAAPPALTGQWDFKFGDLRATIGADLQYPNGSTNTALFPTLTINGQSARVLAFGAGSQADGIYMRHGAQANGGGRFVNQYTVVMDVMYFPASGGNGLPLFQSDPFNHPGNPAEFYLGSKTSQPDPRGLGADGQFDGSLDSSNWYRIAFAVDLTAPPGEQLVKYINGTRVGAQSLPGGIDGRYALGPTALLFTTGIASPGFTLPGFVNSVQFYGECVSSNYIATLGGPEARGIPPAHSSFTISPQIGDPPMLRFTWNGRPNPPVQLQYATNFMNPIWQNLGTLGTESSLDLPLSALPDQQLLLKFDGQPLASVEPGIIGELSLQVDSRTASRRVLPSKQILQTPGLSLQFNGSFARPLDMVFSPDGKTIYVKNASSLLVVDVPTWRMLQQTNYPGANASMHGMAINTAGSHVYVTGSEKEIYDWAVLSNRSVALSRTILLPPKTDPCGIALSPDQATAYVCMSISNTIGVVDLPSGTLTRQISVGFAPYGITMNALGTVACVSDWAGRHPHFGDLTLPSAQTEVVVDSRGVAASGVVSFVDLIQNVETAQVAVDLHPADIKFSVDNKTIYVANANSDTVSVIDAQTKTVTETISLRPVPTLPVGSAGGSMALSPDGTTLYVANGGNNAVAVVQLPNGAQTNSVLTGFIPTDWYPGSVLVDGTNLYVANVKGYGSGNSVVAYFLATLNSIPIPSSETLSKYTAQVQENGRVPQMLQSQRPPRPNQTPVPVPFHAGEPSVFQHVFYIVKENKTYDQMFGDIATGNGNASLSIYGGSLTPNHHNLATQYVLLDNFYCNGIESFDGHAWVTEANNTDYMEKAYGAYTRGSESGSDPMYFSSSGFIWDNVLQHGLTFTNFGELATSFPVPSGKSWLNVYKDFTNHTPNIQFNTYYGIPKLRDHSSTNVSGFNLGIPDQLRAANFLNEFSSVQSNGAWPTFTIIALPGDHTAGAAVGFPTPEAQVADNDLALGQVVETITHSSIASNSVIFVIEDDPLSGYDHVDGHRSICLVVSPYTRRHKTVSTFYNQTGLVHTMEQIMGLPPMNQMDAMGPLMTDCFMPQPDFAPYTAVPNTIPLNQMNPGTLSALRPRDRYWARLSSKLDFSKPDLADPNILSRIIWHSIRGDARYPIEYVGPHGKGLKKFGLIASKSQSGQNDDD